jgi:hypothetical protein
MEMRMNKFLLASLAVLLAATGVSALRRDTRLIRSGTLKEEDQWQAGTNALADSEAAIETLRGEVRDKKNRLKESMSHPQMSPDLLRLLEGETRRNLAAWAELRRQLGIGWDASPDYVLVNKAALKDLQYEELRYQRRPSELTSDLLGLSPAEQSSLAAAIQRVREGPWGEVQRSEPSGDIVAQYTVQPPDPEAELSVSNHFVADIAAAVGQERADLFLPDAWRELSANMAPRQTQTITIRRSVTDGEPDLVCEIREGGKVSVSPVRYATIPMYPAGWFINMFPGLWQDMAKRENFELPAKFHSH